MNILKTENLKKYYGSGSTEVKALDGISLSVEGGLDVPTSGRVLVGGRDISQMKKDELTIFRRRNIGFVFQNYNLLPLMNVWENVVLPLRLDGIRPDREFVDGLLSFLGLESKKYAMPNQLSGGQQQRVALARALAAKPAMILADEPTGNLDSRTGQDVIGLIRTSSEKLSQTVVMITHNEEIAQMAGRILRLEDGRLCNAESFLKKSAAKSQHLQDNSSWMHPVMDKASRIYGGA